ncbi:MAG: peptidoglycan-binding protein [Clostridia bacterium]|nr:peptidoglycan-binding protein [Clostridia bacterium]
MKRLALFLLLLLLLPCLAAGEVILFEDENGKVIMNDDGEIGFVPPDGTYASPAPERETPRPSQTASPIPSTPSPTSAASAYAPVTPLPADASEPFVYTRKLEYGDSGALVEQLQGRLLELGFYNAKVSGGYYKVTRSAVRDFQSHNGLTADGVAGRQTQELLFSDDAVPASATPRPSPTPTPTRYTLMVDVTNQIVRAYTYDENGQYTVLVREMICSTGTKKNPTPLGTTIMPSKRARWGYFPTWDSHAQYLTRIDSANAFHSVLYSAADENTLSVKSFNALGTPASHGCVRLYVSDAKWIYDNCAAGTIITVYEGEYDPEYTMTLKRELNTETLRERDLPAPTPTPVYSRENWPTAYRTLSRGREGEDVYMLQMRLKELGYYSGTVTGGYYGGTIKAVEAFQRDHGLTVDGAAGKQTQSLLFSSAADPAPGPDAADTPLPTAEVTPSPSPTRQPTPQPTPTPAPSAPMVVPEYVPRAPVEDSVG